VSLNRVDEGDGAIVAEINVTPLTDIFLVLLIIFMVTSTALTQQGTPVNLPRAGTGGAEPSGVIITATSDRRIEVNGKPVSRQDLGHELEEVFKRSGDQTVILQGDRDVVLQDAVHIMTVAKEAGAIKIAIATEPEKKGASR